jgi:hypothetical protein
MVPVRHIRLSRVGHNDEARPVARCNVFRDRHDLLLARGHRLLTFVDQVLSDRALVRAEHDDFVFREEPWKKIHVNMVTQPDDNGKGNSWQSS